MSDVLPEGATEGLKDFNADGLYSVEEVTDFVAGTIKIFTPVTIGRARDMAREVKFVSSVNCQWKGVPVTVPFEIEGRSMADAVAGWRAAALVAAEARIQELEKQAFDRTLLAPAGQFRGALNTRGKLNS